MYTDVVMSGLSFKRGNDISPGFPWSVKGEKKPNQPLSSPQKWINGLYLLEPKNTFLLYMSKEVLKKQHGIAFK